MGPQSGYRYAVMKVFANSVYFYMEKNEQGDLSGGLECKGGTLQLRSY